MDNNSVIVLAFTNIMKEKNNEWISLQEIYEEVHKINPNIAEETIRRTIFNHCETSDAFISDPCYISKEKGSGLYKLTDKNVVYNQKRVQSSSDWIKVLDNEEKLNNDNIIEILKYIYLSNNHMCNCGQVAGYMKTDPVAINGIVKSFGKRALKLLKLPEIPGDKGQNRRWNIPFMTNGDFNKDGFFTWIIRPELVEALEKKYDLKNEYDNNIDAGVKFVLDNFDKTLELIKKHPEYQKYKGRVISEYNRIKYIKYTGNMNEHFLKFKGGNHKYANDFAFLKEYGILPNEEISDYLEKHYSDELGHYCGIDDLVIGEKYTNSEIANTFKCSNMGGMRRSHDTNSLVLIAKHNNPLYDDQWSDDGVLNYTGMGTTGDQSIEFSQNKTLATASKEGIKVYLFESYIDNEYYYAGEVELAGPIFSTDETDIDGKIRKVIKYPLKRKDKKANIIIDIEVINQSEKEKIKEVQRHSIEEIKEKARLIETKEVNSKEVKILYRERNQYIAEYTKERSKGICDLCSKEAPFKDKNGKPYLESHHVITLADGGPDGIYNTVAICPNCHRKIHVLKNKDDIKKLENIILKYLLDDNDQENIKKWERLFK